MIGADDLGGPEEEKKNVVLDTTNDMNQTKLYEEDLLNTCEIYKQIKTQTMFDGEQKNIEMRDKLIRTYKKLSTFHK